MAARAKTAASARTKTAAPAHAPSAARSRSKRTANPAPATGDRRVAALLAALRADRRLAPILKDYEATSARGGRSFGSNGLKTGGKLFALFTQGTLVVKLSKDRVGELVAAGVGRAFDPGHGRLMKEWLTVTSADASWLDLAREAYAFVEGATQSRG